MSKRLIKKITLYGLLVMVTISYSCVKIEHTQKPKKLYSEIVSGNAIVLFRIKPLLKTHKLVSSYDAFFRVKIQSAQGSQVAKIIAPSPESPNEVRRGWMYITLPPGAYSINLINAPPTSFIRSVNELLPSYAVDIPKGQPIVYIGSFKMPCKTYYRGGGSVFPLYEIQAIEGCQSPVDMIDETSEAIDISKTHFNQYGPPAISLAHRK